MTDWSSGALERRDKFAAALLAVFAAAGTLVAAARGPLWLTLTFAGLALLSALAGLLFRARHAGVSGREKLRATWHLPLMRVREAAARGLHYNLGVDSEAPESLRLLGLPPGEHPAYVPRAVDAELRARLERAKGERRASLIVLSGPSKAGKSRALFAAAADVLGNAWLLTPKTVNAFSELAASGPRGIGSGPCVVWIDDLEEFAGRADGVNPDTIAMLDEWDRPVAILATQGGKGIELAGPRAQRFREVVGDLLARYPAIPMEPDLAASEVEAVTDRLPAEAVERVVSEGLGEFMIAAPRLLEKFRSGDSLEGRAIVAAAIDCRRAGLLRPLTAKELEQIYVHALVGPPSQERFARGLEWAAHPLYSNVALLRHQRDGGRGGYQIHDYLVGHGRHQPIDGEIWDRVIGEYASAEEELLRVAAVAYAAEDEERAAAAWRRADAGGSAKAAYRLGVLFRERGDEAAARRALRRSEERGYAHAGGALGLMLVNAGELDQGEVALRRAAELDDAQSACWLGWLLECKREDLDGAEAAYRQAEEGGHWHGASKLGWLLKERGDLKGAEAANRRADEHGEAAGAVQLGWILARRGDLKEAEAAFGRGDERGSGQGARMHGWWLEQRGELEDAEAAYARAAERKDWRGTAFLGLALERRGELEEAEAKLRRAAEHGDGYGRRKLGLLLWDRGELDAAEDLLRKATGSDERRKSLIDLGHLLLRREEVDAAAEAFELLEADGDGRGAMELAEIHELRGEEERAEDAYRRAERLARLADNEGGNPDGTCLLGRLLLRRDELDAAEDALGRAADENDLVAMNWLGWLLVNKRDQPRAALAAYRRADVRGDAHAACSVGIILGNGGMPPSARAAFERADTRGDTEGALRLGRFLLNKSTDPDAVELALGAFKRARGRAEARGQESLAEGAGTGIEEAEQRVLST